MRGNAGEGTTESPVREDEGPTHLTELITAPKQNVVVAVAVRCGRRGGGGRGRAYRRSHTAISGLVHRDGTATARTGPAGFIMQLVDKLTTGGGGVPDRGRKDEQPLKVCCCCAVNQQDCTTFGSSVTAAPAPAESRTSDPSAESWLPPPENYHWVNSQPCIRPGSLNRVPASAGVRAGMSPLPGGS